MISEPAPAAFGRGVIIGAGDTAPVQWSDAPEVLIDHAVVADPSSALDRLHRAWLSRTPVVVRLGIDPGLFRGGQSQTAEPWTLTPRFELPHDRLHFLVWANNYDARTGELVWWWSRKAVRLGASPTAGAVDVLLADGTPGWVDGGPRGSVPAGLGPVVHADSVDLGRLAVVRHGDAPGIELADDQRAAVLHGAGPARVIAPAGSGKTRVLTERLRHLLVDRGYDRDGVLAVAYNVRARDELVERTASFRPRVQTLNGMGYEVLAEARGRAPKIAEERDLRRLVDRLVTVKRQRRANTDPIAPYLEALGITRLALRDPAAVESERDDVPGLAEMFPQYRSALRDQGMIDFDEQIYGAIEALVADGELRRHLQSRYRCVLVDEFQDLTPAHLLLIRLLSSPRYDVFGVGDDDQVIYGHAGATPEFLIDFAGFFPGSTEYALGVNHRCPAAVVDAASHLLSWNLRRVPKQITAGPSAPAGDERLSMREVAGDAMVGEVERTVIGWLDAGVPASDIAVLTRVNASLLGPQVALAGRGVALDTNLGTDVLDRLGVRAALAYLRLATSDGSLDRGDLVEVYRRPSRGLPEWIVKWFRPGMSLAALRAVGERIDDEKVSGKLESFVGDLELLAGLARRVKPTRDLLRAIRTQVGLGDAMEQLDRTKSEGSSQLDDLEALEQVAELHPDPASFELWLRETLSRPSQRGGVTMATVHRVKGREWGHVVLYGASVGLLPHRLAEDVEEERRVFHVGITRGREQVVVVADAERTSPFIEQSQADAPEDWGRRRVVSSSTGGALGVMSTIAGTGGTKASKASKASTKGEPAGDETNPVFVALKAWRTEQARQGKVPPYVIFADKVLHEIARAAPDDTRSLARIGGVGPAKLEKYAEDVLAIVAAATAASA